MSERRFWGNGFAQDVLFRIPDRGALSTVELLVSACSDWHNDARLVGGPRLGCAVCEISGSGFTETQVQCRFEIRQCVLLSCATNGIIRVKNLEQNNGLRPALLENLIDSSQCDDFGVLQCEVGPLDDEL